MLLFKRNGNIKDKLNVGKNSKVKNWLYTYGNVSEKSIKFNSDRSVDIYGDVNFLHQGLEELPDFININILYGDFWGAGNNWKTLKGFPNEIYGNFQLSTISVKDNSYNFSEIYIKKLIKIYGKIWTKT